MTQSKFSRILGGTLLVTGTCIGAGMLALPVSTGSAGFMPSMLTFIFYWAAMTLSALLMVEVSLWFDKDTNLISMARKTLGPVGSSFAFFVYIAFFYALMAAYTVGASAIVSKYLYMFHIPSQFAIWIVAGIFATVVYLGTHAVDLVNRVLMVGLVLGYFGLIGMVMPQTHIALLSESHPQFLWGVGSLLVTSFGFHLLIPSLKDYLKADAHALKWSVIWGSFIPLVVYLCWEWVILGAIPITGADGLQDILVQEKQTHRQAFVILIDILSKKFQHPAIQLCAELFCLCAILTSFIGVALALFDFFADSLHIQKQRVGRIQLALLTFLLPVLIAIFYPKFLDMLHYAGFFAAILLVLYPAFMAWSGRYRLQLKGPYQIGGKGLIIAMICFGFSIVTLEILDRIQWLPRAMM